MGSRHLAGRYFTCTSHVKRIPFVSGLKIKAATATTAPIIVPYSMGWGNPNLTPADAEQAWLRIGIDPNEIASPRANPDHEARWGDRCRRTGRVALTALAAGGNVAPRPVRQDGRQQRPRDSRIG